MHQVVGCYMALRCGSSDRVSVQAIIDDVGNEESNPFGSLLRKHYQTVLKWTFEQVVAKIFSAR